MLLQEFSHQLERRLAISPRLNQDVQDLAFAVHGTPDVQLSAVDGDKHFVEMPPHVRARPSPPQLAGNDGAWCTSRVADSSTGDMDHLVSHKLSCARWRSASCNKPSGSSIFRLVPIFN